MAVETLRSGLAEKNINTPIDAWLENVIAGWKLSGFVSDARQTRSSSRQHSSRQESATH
jgi:hypothetical protein